MDKILKDIRKVIGSGDSADIKVQIMSDGVVVFYIYESEIEFIVDTKNKNIEIEFHYNTVDKEVLEELLAIMKILGKNIDKIKGLY